MTGAPVVIGRAVGEVPAAGPLRHDADRGVLLSRRARVLTPSRAGWRLTREELGVLTLPSGQVMARDPTYECFEGEPFARRVRPGRYPVVVTHAGEEGSPHAMVAAAAILLRDEAPARWELALSGGQKLADLRAGQLYGYGVDGGTGCFVDAESAEEFAGKRNFSRLLKAFERGGYRPLMYVHKEEPTIAVFMSGYGDGCYASYWGLDARGEAVCLVTDFGVLTEWTTATLRFGEAAPLGPCRLEHPALARAEVAAELLSAAPSAVKVRLRGAAHAVQEVHLLAREGASWAPRACASEVTVDQDESTYTLLPEAAVEAAALELVVTVGAELVRVEEEPVAKSPVLRRRRA
jgi:hypothetical protein